MKLLKDLKTLLKAISKPVIVFFLCVLPLFASEVEVLKLNHAEKGKSISYFAEIKECKLIKDSLKMKAENGHMSFFDEIYYDFEIIHQNETDLSFKLKSAQNFEFHYKIEGTPCKGNLFVKKENGLEAIKQVEIDYRHALGFPTVKNFHVFLSDSPSPLSVPANKLDGYTAFYEIGLGMALNIHSNIRKNEKRMFNKSDPVFEPLPTFMIRYGPVFANRDGLGMVLVPLKNFALLTTFLLEGEPYKSDGIRQRKKSIYFGPLLKINLLEILYYKDIRSVNHGEVLKVSLAPEFRLMEYWTINPRVFYQYWDNQYVDYYFSVSDEEAHDTNTHTYKGVQTNNWGFTVNNLYKLDKCDVIFSFGYKFYGDSVAASPLVVRDNELRIIGGLIYKFL